MHKERAGFPFAGAVFALTCLGASPAARGDVTIERSTALDVASMVRMHGTSTDSITADKKRTDSESHCEGMMSAFCGNLRGGEIVRLDRDVTWHLEPDKKRYREDPFATPEQLRLMRSRAQALAAKMQACPVPQSQTPIDRSRCEMSPPTVDVRRTDETNVIAGHDARHSIVSLTQSCTDRQTGDVCATVVALDVWLTEDALPGADDQRAFQQAYARKLGLDDPQGVMGGAAAKFLAAYQSQIKQIADKSSGLQGRPLRSVIRILVGGEHCAAAARMREQSASAGSGTLADASQAGVNAAAGSAQSVATGAAQDAVNHAAGTGVAGSILGSAVGASVGKVMGGLFSKKKTADPAPAPAPAAAAAPSPDPFAALAPVARFSIETVSIRTDAIAADRFDIPSGWTRETPKPSTAADREFTCPGAAPP